jgi:hypothetical protein
MLRPKTEESLFNPLEVDETGTVRYIEFTSAAKPRKPALTGNLMHFETIVLVEKPSIARTVHATVSAHLRTSNLLYVVAGPYGVPLAFDYPSGLRWDQYPFIGEPQYRESSPGAWSALAADGFGELQRLTLDVATLSELPVLRIAELDGSSIHAMWLVFEHLVRVGAARESLGTLVLRGLAPSDIARAMKEPIQADAHDALLEVGKFRRWFDFNFTVNATGLFGKALKVADVEALGLVHSKYLVPMLYAVRTLGPMTDGHLVHALGRWAGTGRYAPSTARIGGPASVQPLMDRLLAAGLLEKVEGVGKDLYAVSVAGSRFLAALHPDCDDPDFAFRYERAFGDDLPDVSKARKYLVTYFGRQKRFLG